MTGIAEAAVAVAILLTVGIVAWPSETTHTADSVWARQGAPAVAALIDDVTALQTADPSAAGQIVVALRRDLTKAEGLPWPPERDIATAWTASLGSLEAAIKALTFDGAVPTPQAIRSVSANLSSAAEDLGSIEQSMAHG